MTCMLQVSCHVIFGDMPDLQILWKSRGRALHLRTWVAAYEAPKERATKSVLSCSFQKLLGYARAFSVISKPLANQSYLR